jgi:tetratricopeptide (TPR) repeat protein
LRISSRQLSAWERAGLIAIAADYGFQDLVQLRKLRDLRAQRISASNISASVQAMKAVSGIPNPLLEAGVAKRGPRLVFRHLGTTMDPIAGQFELDFEGGGSRLAIVEDEAPSPVQIQNQIGVLFFQGVRCEEQGKIDEAVALYEETLSLGEHAPAAINLGTILYNRRQFERAEQLYRRATVANPDYALAFFDLGNALDELQRLPEAIDAYKAAIRLSPGYADAHYNLALAHERSNERRRALRHWIAYVKLDPVGPWSNHARLQVRKILDREELAIVWRRSKVGLAKI